MVVASTVDVNSERSSDESLHKDPGLFAFKVSSAGTASIRAGVAYFITEGDTG
jgi:hypothetical protein